MVFLEQGTLITSPSRMCAHPPVPCMQRQRPASPHPCQQLYVTWARAAVNVLGVKDCAIGSSLPPPPPSHTHTHAHRPSVLLEADCCFPVRFVTHHAWRTQVLHRARVSVSDAVHSLAPAEGALWLTAAARLDPHTVIAGLDALGLPLDAHVLAPPRAPSLITDEEVRCSR